MGMNKVRAVLLLTVGGFWLSIAVWVVFSGVILRRTRLGVIAQLLDKFPPVVGKPVFVLCWAILVFGWMAPVSFAAWPVVRAGNTEAAKHPHIGRGPISNAWIVGNLETTKPLRHQMALAIKVRLQVHARCILISHSTTTAGS